MVDDGKTSVGSESRLLARMGSISFLGALVSALMGFLLTFVVARAFGEYGSGIVLQAVGVFSIALGLTKCGMDSVNIWLMPRLKASDPGSVRGTLIFGLTIVVVVGAIGGAVLAVIAPLIAGANEPDLVSALRMLAWFLPFGAVMVTALASTRGLGGILPYVLVGSVGVPTLRPILVLVVAAFGGSAVLAVGAWAVPIVLGMMGALVVLFRQTRDLRYAADVHSWWPSRSQRRSIVRFALPRTVSVGLEQSVLWLDVILVGYLAGTAESGVYGGASRLIAAGFIVDTAIRVVVSPRFSHFLHQDQLASAQGLYRTAAIWLVLFSSPIYIVLAVFAPTILGWLGPGFVAGAPALAILSLGCIVTMSAGNIHSVLLMSGRSGWAAFNKAVVLVLNVGANIVLVPWMGISGAALAWTASMLVDALLASIEVWLLVGLRPEPRAVGYGIIVPLITVGGSAALLQGFWGRDSLWALILTVVAGGLLLLVWCILDRRRLSLDLGRTRDTVSP